MCSRIPQRSAVDIGICGGQGSVIINLMFLRLSHLRDHTIRAPRSPCSVKNESLLSHPSCVLSCSVVSDSLRPHGLYSPPSSSVHGALQAEILEQVATSFSGIFPTQGSNPGLLSLLHWQADSLPLHHLGSPTI